MGSVEKTTRFTSTKRNGISDDVTKEEAHIAQLRHELTALDESIDGLQQVLLLVSEELEKMEGKKQLLKERKSNAYKQQQQMEQTMGQLAERKRALEATIAEKRKCCNSFKQMCKRFKRN